MYYFDSEHVVKYSNKEFVPIKDVVKSLLALEKVMEETPFIINGLMESEDILKLQVFISSVESGSLIEKFLLRLVFKDEDGFNKWVDKLRKMSGMSDGKIIIPALIGGVITAATLYGINNSLPKDSAASLTNTVSGNNNVVINFVSDQIKMEPKDVEKIIASSVKNQKALAKNAVDAVQAAKLDEDADITIDGNNQIRITPSTIAAAPKKYEPPVPDKKIEEFSSILVEIRATDRDSHNSGWRVVVPSLSESRVKLAVDPGIDINDLSKHGAVLADITITSKYDKSKKQYKISEVFLRDWKEDRQ